MTVKTLDEFGFRTQSSSPKAAIASSQSHQEYRVVKKEEKWEKSVLEVEFPKNLPESCILSVTYEGEKRAACLKLYEPKSKRIYFWYDNTGHLPYCLSNLSINELEKNISLKNHPGLDHLEPVKKFDPISDKEVNMTKIIAKDPLSIGGRPSGSIRDLIPKAWEAHIRYHHNYIYDRQLFVGMPYKIVNGNLVSVNYSPPQDIRLTMEKLFENESEEFRGYIDSWVNLFQCPIPSIRRVALDIEVYQSVSTRIPDPEEAKEQVIAASLVDSDGLERVLILRRKDVREGGTKVPFHVKLEYCDDERQILREIFKALIEYPIVLTFNGDDFDLRYLYHRAENLGYKKEEIPISLGNEFALLNYGVHVDLYKFFFNRSIQVYAFSQKYTEFSLNEIAASILGVGKVTLDLSVSELTYTQLAEYCHRDSEITLKLTTFGDELLMKLIMVLVRVSRMPMEDLTRQGVSGWIRNLMYFEHRRLNYLIPLSEDILETKGQVASTAIIKGKKFKGAIVVEPKPGFHFNIAVLDFASLYPSIIKVYNLSYETILCPHPECRSNTIPDLPHWVCRRKKGLSSLLIGSLRDMRVRWYKQKAKDKSLPESLRNLYNVVQLTLKVLLNASYGVMGAEAFELYCPPLAEAVTAIGRYSITKTIEKANSLNINVVYGDTDSIFLDSPTQRQIDDLVQWSEKELGMELEIDKFYRYAVFSKLKKNYLGVYPDGSVDIKGLSGKKRHMPEFLKSAFMEMVKTLGEVKSPNDFDQAKVKIQAIVRTCYTKLKNKEYPLSSLALNMMISKPPSRYTKTTPQHVKAAELLTKAGHEIKAGDIISFVKTTNGQGVKPLQLASINEIDVDKYVEYLESTFEQVLDAVGISMDEIMGITKLESFFFH
ncbi:MAG: polymerase, archaea type [Thermoproteota archaeon]|nr:polymerase, archaea type [Thermoproteota archaeon]